MKLKRWAAAAMISTLTAMAAAGCSGGGSSSTGAVSAVQDKAGAKAKVVKVAQNIVPNVPFSYQNDKGEMEGYTVEYLKLVDEALEEYVFEYDQLEADAMLIGVETGKYDLAANFYYRNPEREKKYAFGEYAYGYTINGLATRADRTDINSLDDMRGKTLTPMNPSGGTRIIIDEYNKRNPDNPILIDDIDQISDADSLRLVAEGKYDAFFVNLNTFNNVNKELKLDLKIAALVSKEPVWVLFNKNNTELAARFDEVTRKLLDDGTLAELAVKWFGYDFFQPIDEVNEAFKFE